MNMPAVEDDDRRPPAAPGAAPSSAARAGTLDDALMLFEDDLRAELPGPDEIIARAATRKRKTRKACATVCIALFAAALYWLDPAYHSEQVATAIGERGSWTLADGSEVALNTDSALRVDFHLRSRQLYLTRGEALFRVRHSHWRSFIVHANRTRVQDIGTVFDVRNTPSGALVTVLEGQVRVTPERGGAQARLLGKDQSVDVAAADLGEVRHVDAGLAALWQRGKLHFDDARLTDVVAELQRYRRTPITLAPSLDGLRISGQFDIDHIDQLLAMLPSLAPVTVTRDAAGGVRILPRGSGAVTAALSRR